MNTWGGAGGLLINNEEFLMKNNRNYYSKDEILRISSTILSEDKSLSGDSILNISAVMHTSKVFSMIK